MKEASSIFNILWIGLNLACVFLFFFFNQQIVSWFAYNLNYYMYPQNNPLFLYSFLPCLFFALELAIAQSVALRIFRINLSRHWGILTFASVFLAFLVASFFAHIGYIVGTIIWSSTSVSAIKTPFINITGSLFAGLSFKMSVVSIQSLLIKRKKRLHWVIPTMVAYGCLAIYIFLVTLFVIPSNPVYYAVDIRFLVLFFGGGSIGFAIAANIEAKTLLEIAESNECDYEKPKHLSPA